MRTSGRIWVGVIAISCILLAFGAIPQIMDWFPYAAWHLMLVWLQCALFSGAVVLVIRAYIMENEVIPYE